MPLLVSDPGAARLAERDAYLVQRVAAPPARVPAPVSAPEPHAADYAAAHADQAWEGDPEVALLGGILAGGTIPPAVRERVRGDDFARPHLRAAYRVLGDMLARGEDVSSLALVAAAFDADGCSNGALLAAELTAHHDADARTLEALAGHVRTQADRRRLRVALVEARAALDVPGSDAAEVAARVAGAAAALASGTGGGFLPAAEIGRRLLHTLMERDEAARAGRPTGMLSGFRSVDREAWGFRDGDLLVVGGVPGSGKTALGLQMALNVAGAGEAEGGGAVAYVSAEMPGPSLLERAVCNFARIDTLAVRRMQLTDDEHPRLLRAVNLVQQLPLHVDDEPCPDVGLVLARARALAAEHRAGGRKLRLIVVDFAQLLEDADTARDGRPEMLRRIAYRLKGLAKQAQCVVLALCQLNDKEIEARPDKRPVIADLQGSSGWRQAADFVALCYRASMYDPTKRPYPGEPDAIDVEFGKARDLSPFTARLLARLDHMRLYDHA